MKHRFIIPFDKIVAFHSEASYRCGLIYFWEWKDSWVEKRFLKKDIKYPSGWYAWDGDVRTTDEEFRNHGVFFDYDNFGQRKAYPDNKEIVMLPKIIISLDDGTNINVYCKDSTYQEYVMNLFGNISCGGDISNIICEVNIDEEDSFINFLNENGYIEN
jgi:hypothetical protein